MEDQTVKCVQTDQLKKVLGENYEGLSLFDLDPNVKPDEYDYNTYSSRFVAVMNFRNIQVIGGTYENHLSTMQYQCDICQHTWSEKAFLVQRNGCPSCLQKQRHIVHEKKLWKRSLAIISDKQGVVKGVPERDPDQKPTINDKFLLECQHGHRFPSSHHRLRHNQWCPVCAASNASNKNPFSKHVYGKRKTNPEKFQKLKEIATIKGAHIAESRWVAGKYTLICTQCQEEFSLIARQICNNHYLCPNKCVRGHRYSIHIGQKNR